MADGSLLASECLQRFGIFLTVKQCVADDGMALSRQALPKNSCGLSSAYIHYLVNLSAGMGLGSSKTARAWKTK